MTRLRCSGPQLPLTPSPASTSHGPSSGEEQETGGPGPPTALHRPLLGMSDNDVTAGGAVRTGHRRVVKAQAQPMSKGRNLFKGWTPDIIWGTLDSGGFGRCTPIGLSSDNKPRRCPDESYRH